VFTSLAGGPCMRCGEIVTDETLALDREEYVAGAPEQQVISLNGLLASQAINNALALLTDYAPGLPVPAMIRYDGLGPEMKPDAYASRPCPHYPLEDAGWRFVLPARRVAS